VILTAFTLLAASGAQFVEDYPRLRSDVQAHYLSSYDRSGGNDDGFDGTYSALYVDERGEHVIFDVKGPGTLYNLWFTSRVNGRSPLGWGRLKFYFDGEETPRVDMEADELFSGRHSPFKPPFVYHAFQSTGGYVSRPSSPKSTFNAAGSVGILASPAATALQSPSATRGGGLDQRPLRRLVVHGSDERT